MLTTKKLVTLVLMFALVAIALVLAGCKKDYEELDITILKQTLEESNHEVWRYKEVSRKEAEEWAKANNNLGYIEAKDDPVNTDHRYYILLIRKGSAESLYEQLYIMATSKETGERY